MAALISAMAWPVRFTELPETGGKIPEAQAPYSSRGELWRCQIDCSALHEDLAHAVSLQADDGAGIA